MSLLQLGEYKRGFAEYEWRCQTGQFLSFPSSRPKWDGRPIPDKTLLIFAEQGAGDAIQFARYLPMVAERCAKLVVVCPKDLLPVFAKVCGPSQICEPDQIGVAEFDAYLPLLSLPHIFGTTLATIPSEIPYVDGTALRTQKQNPALVLPPSPYPKVGIAWAGNPAHRNDHDRSSALQNFLPILSTPRIAFYSLQKRGATSRTRSTSLHSSNAGSWTAISRLRRSGGCHRSVRLSH